MKRNREKNSILKRILCVILTVCITAPGVVAYASVSDSDIVVQQKEEKSVGTENSTDNLRTAVRTLGEDEIAVSVSDVFYMSGDTDTGTANILEQDESGAYLLTRDILSQNAAYGFNLKLDMTAGGEGWDIIDGDTYQVTLDIGDGNSPVKLVTDQGEVKSLAVDNELKIGNYTLEDGMLTITYNDALKSMEEQTVAANIRVGFSIDNEKIIAEKIESLNLKAGNDNIIISIPAESNGEDNLEIPIINGNDVIGNVPSNNSGTAGKEIQGNISGQNKWVDDVIVEAGTDAVAGSYTGKILNGSIDSTANEAEFEIDSKLLDEYLAKVEEIAGNREDYDGTEEWWNSTAGLGPIEFTVNLGDASYWSDFSTDGKQYSAINEKGLTVELYDSKDNTIKIADAIFNINNSQLELTMKFVASSIYSRHGEVGGDGDEIHAGLRFFLKMSGDKFADNDSYEVSWNENRELTFTKAGGGGDSEGGETQFEISKVVLDGKTEDGGINTTVSEKKFTYTIEAGKKQKDRIEETFKYVSLEGTVLTDIIPAGLSVKEIRVNNIPLAEETYSMVGNTLTYTFTDEDSKTDLSDAGNPAYGKAKVEIDVEAGAGSNVAFDKGLINSAAITESGTSNSGIATQTTVIKKPSLSKVGTIDPYDSNRVSWEITAETYFSHAVDSYIVDCIDNQVQSYDTDSLSLDGKKLSVTDFRSTVLDEKYSYDNLKNSAGNGAGLVRELLGSLGSATNDPDAYLITVNREDMLIIPYAPYHNGIRSIKYNTVLNPEYLENVLQAGGSAEIQNEVTLLWDYNGEGPGPDELEWYVGISKNPVITDSDVVKSGVGYSESNHTATWRVRLDPYGKGFAGDVTIKDILKNDDQVLLDNSVRLYKYIKNGTDFELDAGFNPKTLTKIGNESFTGVNKDNNYSYLKCDENGIIGPGEYSILQIPVNDTSANVRYVVEFQTEVKNNKILSNHGGGTLDNNVEVTYSNGVKSIENSGKQTAANHLISKAAVNQDGSNSPYSFTDRTVTWEVTVNPYSLDIVNAVLNETLPFGSTLKSWQVKADSDGTFEGDTDAVSDEVQLEGIKIVRNKPSDQQVTAGTGNENGEFTPGTGGKFFQRTEVFEFKTINPTGDCTIDKPYIFRFTTQVTDDEYLKKFLMQDYSEVTFLNTATLNGSISGKGITNATVSAPCTIKPAPVVKSGIPCDSNSDEPGSVTWTVYINKNKVDINGSTIEENFGSSGILEMDPDTLKIYEMPTVPSNGELSNANVNEINPAEVGTIEFSSGKFVIKINDKGPFDKCLKLVFKTYLVDEWRNRVSPLTNKVTVNQSGGYSCSSGTVDSNYTEEFEFSKWANSSASTMLRVLKYSEQNDNHGADKFSLQGAVMNLDAYSKQGEAYTYDTVRSKQRTTGKTGYANFVSLRENIIYDLYETKAPSGYAVDSTKHFYYMFVGDGDGYQNEEQITAKIMKGSEAKTVNVKLIKKKTVNEKSGYQKEDRDIAFGNNPAEGMSFYIKKYNGDENAELLDHIKFVLKPANPSLVVQEKTTQDGIARFSNIDPGEYTLEEVVPENLKEYYTIAPIVIRIAADKDNKAVITLPNGIGNNAGKIEINTTDAADGLIIKNLYKKGSIILKKVDAGTGNPLQGAAFSIYQGNSHTPLREAVSSNEKGIVRFDDLPFSQTGYRVEETKAPDKYTASGTAITISAQDMRDGANEDGFVVDLSGADKVSQYIENSRITADVKFKKYLRLKDYDFEANDYNRLLTTGRTFTLTSADEDTSSYIKNTGGNYSFKNVNGEWVRAIDKVDIADGASYIFKEIPLGKYRLNEVTSEEKGDKYTLCNVDIDLISAYEQNKLSAENNTYYVNFQEDENDDEGTVVNNLLSTPIYLNKTDSLTGELMDTGAEFDLTGTPAETSNIIFQKKCIVKDGKLVLSDNNPIILPIGSYKLTETKAPENYVVSEKKYSITVVSEFKATGNAAVAYIKPDSDTSENMGVVCSDENKPYAIPNDAIKGSLSLLKLGDGYTNSGADQNDPADDTVVLKDGIPVSDAEFELLPVVQKKGKWQTVKVTDADGVTADKSMPSETTGTDGTLIFEDLPYCDYLLVEKTPVGYYAMDPVLLKKEYFEISVSDDATAEKTFQWNGQYNEVTYDGNVYIEGEDKDFSKGEGGVNTITDMPVVVDASFTKIVIDHVQDTEGNVLSDAKFTVARLGSGGGANDDEPFSASYDLSRTFVPYAPCSAVVPDKKGVVVLKDLICGIYEVKETEWKEGSRPVDAKPVVVMYLKVAPNDRGGFSIIRYDSIENGELTGNSNNVIEINKGVDETPEDMGIVANSPYELGSVVFSKKSNGGNRALNGAKFGLYRKNDTGEYEPVEMYDGGKPVTAQTSGDGDDKGKAEFKYLTYGKYAVRELEAPEGHVLDNTYYEFEISEGHLTGNITNTGVTDNEIINRQNSYQIQKMDMSGMLLNGAVFTVTGRFANGTAAVTKTYTVNGTSALIAGELAAGERYVIRESAAPAGYAIAAPVTVTMDEHGQLRDSAGNAIADNKVAVRDEMIDMGLYKVSAEDFRLAGTSAVTRLEGAEFIVTPAAGSAFADGSKTLVINDQNYSTALKGKLIVGNSYIVTEAKAPYGYTIAAPFTFTVNSGGDVSVAAAANSYAKTGSAGQNVIYVSDEKSTGEVTLTKKDAQSGEELKSVGFRLYSKNVAGNYVPVGDKALYTGNTYKITGAAAFDSGTANSPANGKLTISGLAWGSYQLIETNALDGYVLDETPYQFEITGTKANGMTVDLGTVTNSKTTVKVRKVNESGSDISGATLTILDKNKKEILRWVSDGNVYTATGLKTGESYTLHEVKAPAGYNLAKDITFTVPVNGEYELSMIDKKKAKPTPKPDGTTGSITVTKTIFYDGKPLAVHDLSFYAALYSDADLTNRVSEIAELAFTGSYSTTATFDNLPFGTYYVAEVDAFGDVYDGSDIGMEVEVIDQQCVLTKTSPHGSAVIKNAMPGLPDGFYIDPTGKLTVTKKVLNKDKTAETVKNTSFYVTLFSDEDYLLAVSDPMEIEIANGSSGTVIFEELALGTYYLAETDEYGFPVDADSDDFAYTPSFSEDTFEIMDENQSVEVILTNTLKKGESTPKATVTTRPGTYSASPSRSTLRTANTTSKAANSKTGDETPLFWYFALFAAASAGIILIVGRKRRKEK